MSVSKRALFSTIATLSLAVSFTAVGGVAANASEAKTVQGVSSSDSCWADLATGQSLCVAEGVDLAAAVASTTGINITAPAGTTIGGSKLSSASAKVALLSTSAASTATIVSAVYDDINYGGGTFVMSAPSGGCGWAVSSLAAYGWNDRVSSFKSFAGCTTALWKNINYGGTKIGYSTSKASLGTMNDAASSWATD